MGKKQAILFALTLLVSMLMSLQLLGSWMEPQAQSQLNLYQSDLLLHASEWDGLDQAVQGNSSLRTSFLGENPVQDALKNYESVRASAQKDLDRLSRKMSSQSKTRPSTNIRPSQDLAPNAPAVPNTPPLTSRRLRDELDLRIGILYAKAKKQDKALQTWTQLINAPHGQNSSPAVVQTAHVLKNLWSDPPQIFPTAEPLLTQNLKGWFRFQSLSRLYNLQQRQDALQTLRAVEQDRAMSAFTRLLMVGAAPVLGSAIGFTILMVWGIRAFLHRKTLQSSVKDFAHTNDLAFAAAHTNGAGPVVAVMTPEQGDNSMQFSQQGIVSWPVETIWQIMVLWFIAFFAVSFMVPLGLALLGFNSATFDGRMQGSFTLFIYLCLMAVGFGILQLSLRRFIPNVLKWFRVRWSGNWFLWGLGGYFVALPFVLIVSLVNQKLLHEQGGGNPILEVILQSHDGLTIGLLWFLVAVCAPLFEESLFRGFFLTSLTRYVPTWAAIAFSAFLFALAHLNLGDLLPLTVLGMILGFVYLRSHNLLASMLLHSLWNSGSFMGLLILGSGST